ncbi:MAG: lipopolysaccharide heptosyltransferase II [Chthoniobacteraceae bacterium]
MEKIVIRSSNWLGDAVLSVPAVRAMKRSHPGAHIAVLTPEKLADVWHLVAEVDEVIAFPSARGGVSGVLNIFRVAKLIRGRGFTDGVVFPNSLRTGLEMWLARIPRRTGYPGHARRSFFLTNVLREENGKVATGPGRHQVHHYLHLAEFLGAETDADASFGFPDAAAKKVREPGVPARIAVCAGAEYGPAKRWLPERFAEVMQDVGGSTPCRWQLVGVAKDRESAAEIATLCENPANVENTCGETTLSQLIAILRESDALLTNDTGTMHLATLLGVPVVAIFGSTEPALTGPLGAGHVVVRKRAECSPCFLRECPIDFRCMKEVEADTVAAALRGVLGIDVSA